jgi:16S rRNA (guanine966-N2)-methyltransferase
MLRITGGAFKGLPLVAPRRIRATEAKVRQALFNILGDVSGARAIDGFAGSGALGLEALSRGAAFVAFIESDAEAVISIRDNLERLKQGISREAWRVLHLDIGRGLRELARTERPFDLVLLDPPYGTDDGKKALNAVVDCAILSPAGLIVMEHRRQTNLPSTVGPARQITQHRYGDTVLSLYRLG